MSVGKHPNSRSKSTFHFDESLHPPPYPLSGDGKKKAKKKIRIYKDDKGYYMKSIKNKKIRIKGKENMSMADLVKFLIVYLKPKRKNKNNKKGVKHTDKVDARAFIDTSKSDAIHAIDRARDVERKLQDLKIEIAKKEDDGQNKMVLYTPENKEKKNFKHMTPADKRKYLEDHPEIGETIQDWRDEVVNMVDTKDSKLKEKNKAEIKRLQTERETIRKERLLNMYGKQLNTLKKQLKEKAKIDYKKDAKFQELLPLFEQYKIIDTSAVEEKLNDEYDKKIDKLMQENDVEHKGSGIKDGEGTTDAELNKIMAPYPEYLGAIASNEIETKILPHVKKQSRGCFIINTDSASKAGEHWQCVFYDARPTVGSNSIEFFDSYAEESSKGILRGIKAIVDKLDAPTYLKLKINKIKHQNNKSANCGQFCCKFLIDRLGRNKSFSECTGYDDSKKQEKDIEAWKKKLKIKDFTYISSNKFKGGNIIYDVKQGATNAVNTVSNAVSTATNAISETANKAVQEVKDRFSGLRDTAPPAFRNFIANNHLQKIESIAIGRKPLASMISKIANWMSSGKFEENRKNLNYDDIYHLFMVIKLQTGLYKMEKNEVVSIKKYDSFDKTAQWYYVPANMIGNTTLGDLITGGIRDAGSAKTFFQYDARSQNCQKFIKDMLKSNGIWNDAINKFVMQDTQGLLRGMESLGEKAKGITDLAGKIDTFLNGKGRKNKK